MIISIILVISYVLCSSLGLILLKSGLNQGMIFSIGINCIEIKFHLLLVAGAVLYIISFLLNMIVMSRFNLNYIYPMSAGLIYIAILVFSFIILKEKISFMQMIGMTAILLGILIINIKS